MAGSPKVNWPLSCLNDRGAAARARPDESILSAFSPFLLSVSPLQSQYSLVPSRHCKPNGRTDGPQTDARRTPYAFLPPPPRRRLPQTLLAPLARGTTGRPNRTQPAKSPFIRADKTHDPYAAAAGCTGLGYKAGPRLIALPHSLSESGADTGNSGKELERVVLRPPASHSPVSGC